MFDETNPVEDPENSHEEIDDGFVDHIRLTAKNFETLVMHFRGKMIKGGASLPTRYGRIEVHIGDALVVERDDVVRVDYPDVGKRYAEVDG